MNEPILQLSGITRSFQNGETRTEVLRGIDLVVHPGELVALIGPSGTGKSTLLQLAGLLEAPTSGSVRIVGVETNLASERERTAMRGHRIGFVYQFHHLLPEFSALENVIVPQMVIGVPRGQAAARAAELLDSVGLYHRAHHRPARLSGGEQQRVAIARALANRPSLLLADEPTGNLDSATSESVFDLLSGLVRDGGLAALIATHNSELAQSMDRTVELRDGKMAGT
jgi:lipoprotein-releasing system ATP-binding protein